MLRSQSYFLQDFVDMPEMQMIRLVLDRGGEDWMRGQGLPECVIAWVLEPS